MIFLKNDMIIASEVISSRHILRLKISKVSKLAAGRDNWTRKINIIAYMLIIHLVLKSRPLKDLTAAATSRLYNNNNYRFQFHR